MRALILPLLFLSQIAFSQIIVDKEAFSTQFSTAFELAKKGFPSDYADFGVADHIEVEYLENTGINCLKVGFLCFSKDEAIRSKEMLAEYVRPLIPGDFKETKGYCSSCSDYLKYTFEFNSTEFSEVKKRPAVEIGVFEEKSDLMVEVLIFEPHFKVGG